MVKDNKEILTNTVDILINSLEKYKSNKKNAELLERAKKLKDKILKEEKV